MTINLTIRPFIEDDTDPVVALWHAAKLTRPWNDPERDIARKLEVQRELFVVGTVNGIIAATAMGGYDGHRGWVNYLAVDEQWRGHGFGRQIMAHLEDTLISRGCPKLNLQVRAGNETAVAFYKSAGYEIDNTVSLGKRLIPDT